MYLEERYNQLKKDLSDNEENAAADFRARLGPGSHPNKRILPQSIWAKDNNKSNSSKQQEHQQQEQQQRPQQ